LNFVFIINVPMNKRIEVGTDRKFRIG